MRYLSSLTLTSLIPFRNPTDHLDTKSSQQRIRMILRHGDIATLLNLLLGLELILNIFLLGEEFLGFERGYASRSCQTLAFWANLLNLGYWKVHTCTGNSLPVPLILHITRCKHSVDIRIARPRLGDHIALSISTKLALH
jgi:hypothetical protein